MASWWCLKDLEVTTKCGDCLETLKDPKTLPCLHSFCLMCLDNLAADAKRRRQHEISCVVCETSIPVPEENTFRDFPTSFLLDRFKEILTVFSENQAAKTCMNCNEGKMVISYCFVCQDYLCFSCERTHRRLKVTRGHRSVSLEKGNLLDLLRRPVMCKHESHREEALNYYCEDCSECICHICYDDCHWRCVVVDIKQAAGQGRKRLDKILKKAEDEIAASKDEIQKSEDIFMSRKKKLRAARENVKATVKKLIKTLEQHEKAVLTKIKDISRHQQKRHERRKRKLELFITQLTSPVEHGKCVLKRNVDMEIVKDHNTIIDRCKDLLNSKETDALVLPFVNYAEDEICEIAQYGPGQLIVSNTDPSQCTARVEEPTESVVGRETKIVVRTRDANSKQCYQKDDQIKMKIQGPWGEEIETASEDKSDGRYEFSFTPEFDGRHDLIISVNGRPLTDSSLRVKVSPCLYQKAFELGSNGQFRHPCGIAIDKHSGNVAVADSLNKTIQIFDSEGKFLRQFGDIRDSTKNLQSPYAVEFSTSGQIIVIEECGTMILCSKEGNFLNYVDYIGHVRKPCSVSVKSNGDLIVCDRTDADVKILSPHGCHKRDSFAGDPVLDGSPSCAVHRKDRFFVSFPKARRVKVFSEDGDFLYDIGTSKEVNEQLSRPSGLAIDKSKNLIVCDSDGCRLQVFTLDGRHVTSIEGRNNGFQSPQFIAVSKDGRLFFTDTGRKCVHVFH